MDLLDEHLIKENLPPKDLRTPNPRFWAAVYIFCIILGAYFGLRGFSLWVAVSLVAFLGILSVLAEGIYWHIRKEKDKKENCQILRNPFWFEVLERGFSAGVFVIILGILFSRLSDLP